VEGQYFQMSPIDISVNLHMGVPRFLVNKLLYVL